MIIGIDITLFCLERPTGVPLIARYLTEALVQAFPSDTYVLFGCVPLASRQSIMRLPIMKQPNICLKLIPLPHRLFRYLLPLWQRWQWPTVEFFTGHLDVFHNFDWFMLPATAPVTATIYDLTPLTHPEWHTAANIAVFTKRLELVIKKCAHIFSISYHTKNELLQFFPQLNNKVSVVYPDGVLHPQAVIQKGIKPGYLFVVGTVEPRKNLVRVLKAYVQLAAISKMPPLVVAGSIGWDKEASKLLRQSKSIISVGYVAHDQLGGWYKHALALVYPSLAEGFGLPIVEAMGSGTMVITSNVTSMPEVGGDAAWYCNPLSITSIKQVMMQAVTASAKERQQRIIKGYKQARLFSYSKAAKQMHALWEQLTNNMGE